MKEHSRSVFLVEGLEPSWLGTRAKRAAYGTLVALSLGLIFGMGVGLIFGASAGRIFGVSAGLSGGLGVGLMVLLGIGLGCWSESPLKNGVMSGSIGGLLIFGLGGGLGGGPITGLSAGLIGGLGVGSLNRITLVETLSWSGISFGRGRSPARSSD
jgi:hypothetical protein